MLSYRVTTKECYVEITFENVCTSKHLDKSMVSTLPIKPTSTNGVCYVSFFNLERDEKGHQNPTFNILWLSLCM